MQDRESQRPIVSTVHILSSGRMISSVEEYMEVEDRFGWVDKTAIVAKLLALRRLTEERKKSIIVLFEDGQIIREYINVDPSFNPLTTSTQPDEQNELLFS
jgi:hypothetical protein